MKRGTLADMRVGVVVHGDRDRTIVAVASPVYPAGSPADQQAVASRAAGIDPVLRLLLDDGTSMLVHGGNTLLASDPLPVFTHTATVRGVVRGVPVRRHGRFWWAAYQVCGGLVWSSRDLTDLVPLEAPGTFAELRAAGVSR